MFKSKKFKYGSVSVILTAVFIAVVILVNAVVSIVNKNGKFNVDVTTDLLYSISDASRTLLDGNTLPVTLYFLQERDAVKEDSNSEGFMLNLVESYADVYKWIDVEYIDLEKNPKFKDRYTKSSSEKLAKTSVVVDCPTTGEYKVITSEDYFLLEDQTNYLYTYKVATGFQGELALTSALLNVTTPDDLAAAVEIGHGESNSKPLSDFLDDVGYEVTSIDLAKSDIAENVSLLVINYPTRDFVGTIEQTGVASEIDKLMEYMNRPDAHLMVFMSPSTPQLKQFEEFLAVFGTSVVRSVITDNENSVSGTGGTMLYGNYNASEETGAAQIVSRMNGEYRSVFNLAAPIEILFNQKNYITVSPVVTTSNTATYADSGENGSGRYNLMTLSTKETGAGKSDLLLCSSEYFNAFLEQSKYANRDLMNSIALYFGAANVTPDIKVKLFDSTSIDISENSSRTWGILITAAPAALVLLIGIVVWSKRRHL